MATYNIYDYDNKVELGEPTTVVVLNDDDTEIVSITASDPERQAEDESIIQEYIGYGATPLDALKLFAGAYGQVWNADNIGEAAGAPEGVSEEAEVSEEVDETLTSAAEDEAPEDEAPEVDEARETSSGDVAQITSGAIMAMTKDDGTVVTLLKSDPEQGAVYRHDGEWHPLVDPTVLDELTFVGVTASSEPIFDKYEKVDKLVTIGHYLPSAGGPTWPDIAEAFDEPEHADEIEIYSEESEEVASEGEADEASETEDEDEEAVTAALTLDGPSDLANAISAALLNKDLRWFVERRVAALGLEAQLPWQNG